MKTKPMIVNLLIGLVAVVAVFVVVVALRPGDFRVTRSATIAAPPEAVFPHVNDLRNWDAWSPWAKLDPDAKFTYEGPAAGVGAAFSWSGNRKVGAGRMAITESRPNERIRFQLDFLKPMRASNTTEFNFRPDGGQTEVTWTMSGKNNFLGKAFSLFVNCDTMVGGDFEKGLAQLGSVVAAQTRK